MTAFLLQESSEYSQSHTSRNITGGSVSRGSRPESETLRVKDEAKK